jgi:hypothetical protein
MVIVVLCHTFEWDVSLFNGPRFMTLAALAALVCRVLLTCGAFGLRR